jgi:thioredoxin-dependent peroxiredoxin
MILSGQKMPKFSGIDQNGIPINSGQLKGKKLAIYFYPADDTPTCTKQACNLRDHYELLVRAGITVIGISPDNVKKHKNFEQKYALPFSLIADSDTAIAQLFGVWGPKTFMGKNYIGLHRTTFLVSEKGIVEHVISKPITKAHAEEILAHWQ